MLASGRLTHQRRRARRRARRPHRADARHARLRARRDRRLADPRRARRPARRAAPRPHADPALDRRARAPPSGWPATSSSGAACASARTCSSRTCRSGSPPTTSSRRSRRCPASSAASARRPARARPSCSRSSAPRSCRRRRSQAELAKIWTNILRYAEFALPNLLMMECEQYGANVFDVDRPDQPRLPARRDGPPGADRRRLPAQGLHLLRGALERARHAAGRLARARDGAAVPRQGPEVAPRRLAARPQGGRARADVQARLRRRARLALLQADPAARARAGARGAPRPARAGRVRAAGDGARGRRRGRDRDQPLRLRGPAATPAARTRSWSTRGTCSASAQVFGTVETLARVE